MGRWVSDALGTKQPTFTIGKAVLDATAVSGAQTLTIPNASGTVVLTGSSPSLALITATTGLLITNFGSQAMAGLTANTQIVGTATANATFAMGRWSNDDSASDIRFFKSKNATVGSGTALGIKTDIGSISAYGYATSTVTGLYAQIILSSSGTSSSTSSPGRIVFNTTPIGALTPSTALVLDDAQQATFSGAVSISGDLSTSLGGNATFGAPSRYSGVAATACQVLGTSISTGLMVGAWAASAAGPQILLYKSRDTVVGSSTAAQTVSNDSIGIIKWGATSNTTTPVSVATIEAITTASTTTNGSASMIFSVGTNSASPTEIFRITASRVLDASTARIITKSYGSSIVAKGTVTTTCAIDWTAGDNQRFTTTNSTACTLTFNVNPSAPCYVSLQITAPATPTAFTSVPTIKGTAIVMPTASKINQYILFWDGTNYWNVGSVLNA